MHSLINAIFREIKRKIIRDRVTDIGISDHNLVYVLRKAGVPTEPPRFVET